MKPLAIKWRVALAGVAGIAAVIAVISTVAYLELEESLVQHDDTAMGARLSGMLSHVDREDANGVVSRILRGMGEGPHRGPMAYRVWLEGHPASRAVGWSPFGAQATPPAPSPGHAPRVGETTFFYFPLAGEDCRAAWARRQTANGVVNVLLASSQKHMRQELHEFLRMLLVLGGSMLVGTAVAGSLIVQWALKPIRRTAERLRRVSEHSLGSEPLADMRVPSELRPFQDAVADLLRRLDLALEQWRRFTADASHEIRTPMALAKSTLQVATSQPRDAREYRQAIVAALTDLDRMEALVTQLLTLAHIDGAPQPANLAEVPLGPLLRDLAERFDAQASESGGCVVLGDVPDASTRGDEAQLVQLLVNVTANAVKHGPAGGTVRLSLAREPAGHCTIGVHDEGGQVSPEELEKLFDRFYRTDPSRARETGGTGLGLAIARGIARRHGGDIRITSTPRDGTTVHIVLPLHEESQPSPDRGG